jgi:hypothetical protein
MTPASDDRGRVDSARDTFLLEKATALEENGGAVEFGGVEAACGGGAPELVEALSLSRRAGRAAGRL